LVFNLLQAVLTSMKLDQEVGVVMGRTVAGIDYDILLIKLANRLPVAAVEVKKTGCSKESRDIIWFGKTEEGAELKTNRVAGQSYDELWLRNDLWNDYNRKPLASCWFIRKGRGRRKCRC
jgi:hypothetical protein